MGAFKAEATGGLNPSWNLWCVYRVTQSHLLQVGASEPGWDVSKMWVLPCSTGSFTVFFVFAFHQTGIIRSARALKIFVTNLFRLVCPSHRDYEIFKDFLSKLFLHKTQLQEFRVASSDRWKWSFQWMTWVKNQIKRMDGWMEVNVVKVTKSCFSSFFQRVESSSAQSQKEQPGFSLADFLVLLKLVCLQKRNSNLS